MVYCVGGFAIREEKIIVNDAQALAMNQNLAYIGKQLAAISDAVKAIAESLRSQEEAKLSEGASPEKPND